MGPWAGAQAH
jgi:glutathione-independent formaldehyde dehydrogenase